VKRSKTISGSLRDFKQIKIEACDVLYLGFGYFLVQECDILVLILMYTLEGNAE